MRSNRFCFLLVALVSFRAAAAEFEFVVIGDTRPRFESESFRPFEGLISKINSLQPALAVNLGDLIYGYGPLSKEHQWRKYETVVKGIRVPYFQVPGNHDTHSKEARRIYGRHFGKFHQSFDRNECHFVLLDNTENERWGWFSPAQLEWLRSDLERATARSVFVFMHFPVWEPERIKPAYHEVWLKTLHPLFRASRVKAVFGGHYHTYGPTREFDGIRYFITGGGGAELIPEYKKSGGVHHFMRVKVLKDDLEVRVVTEQGELTDPEADVMGGLQFAARHVSRLGIKRDAQDLRTGTPLTVTVKNPYLTAMTGQAAWLMDPSSFSLQPASVPIEIPAGATRNYYFALKALQDTAPLQTLPRLEFDVASAGARHRFHREVRFLNEMTSAYREKGPTVDGTLTDWRGAAFLKLGERLEPEAELRSCFDTQNIYLALTVPKCDDDETKESGFSDEIQIGVARPLNGTDFGADVLRLGINSNAPEVKDRTPGHKGEVAIPGVKSASRSAGAQTTYEICLPFRLIKGLKASGGSRLVLDLAFPVPDRGAEPAQAEGPSVNTFSFRVRYGSDSLVPIYFVELNLERKP